MRLTILFRIALFAVLAPAQAQTADQIIAKYYETVGGVDKWKNMKSMKAEGKVPTPQGEFPMVTYMKSPNKLKSVITVQGKEIVQIAYDGTTAWTLNPFAGGTSATKLDAETTKIIADQEQEPLIDYAKKGHAVTLEGKEEIDGVQCYKLKLEKNKNNSKDDATEYHYFDVESAVRIMTKMFAQAGPTKGMESQVLYSDYQEVDGVMIPFSVEQKVAGQPMGFKMQYTKVTINEDLADSVFAFPGN